MLRDKGSFVLVRNRKRHRFQIGKIPFTPRVSVNAATTLDDTMDTVLIENNGFAPDWGCNPFLSDSTVFNENSVASIIAELWQR